MANNTKHLVYAILKFLNEQAATGNLSEDGKESLEVATQCLEAVYDVYPHETATATTYPLPPGGLPEIFTTGLAQLGCAVATGAVPKSTSVSDSDKVAADKEKAAGNDLMKQEKFEEALGCYDKAISIDCTNAVYYCNRAAALSKLQRHEKAIEDCMAALNIDPNYSKAYGRKGIAHIALSQFDAARDSYRQAVELDPSNDSYKSCLEQAEQKCHEQAASGALSGGMGMGGMPPGMGGMDFSQLLNNPALMNMATQMMSNPQMQNMMGNMMAGMGGGGGAPGGGPGGPPANFEAMMNAGQQLASQMREQNPDLVDQLRGEAMRGGMGGEGPPPPGNTDNTDQTPPPGTS